jgi:hypothetical protein
VQCRSPSNLTQLERICREEWEKLPKYRCAKLVASYPRRLEGVIAAKCASTKYWVKGLNTYSSSQSLEPPTHFRVFLHCRIIVKTSKLWHNTWNHVVTQKVLNKSKCILYNCYSYYTYGKNISNKLIEMTVHYFKTWWSVNTENYTLVSSVVAKTIKRYDETDCHEDRHRKGRCRVVMAFVCWMKKVGPKCSV